MNILLVAIYQLPRVDGSVYYFNVRATWRCNTINICITQYSKTSYSYSD